MINYAEFLKKKNREIEDNYLKNLEKITQIRNETRGLEDKFLKFIFMIADRILMMSEFEKEYSESYYKEKTLDELKAFNQTVFSEVLPENYEKSYANPEFSVGIFGNELGTIFSTFYIQFRGFLSYSIKHHRYLMEPWNKSFLEFYELIKKGISDKDSFQKVTTKAYKKLTVENQVMRFLENYSYEASGFRSLVMTADFSDFRYLYQYGKYISENETKTAEFFLNYPEEKIQKLAEAMVKAFIRGFELARKDVSQKETVNVYYNIGQEKLVRVLVNELADKNLKALLNTVSSTTINRQYNYDHRFIGALFVDEDFIAKSINIIEQAAEKCGDELLKFAGPFYFDKFGEKPFDPKQKDACLKLSSEQQKLIQKMNIERSKIIDKYISRSKTSFCIIGFPVPEIGEKFEDIFEETLAINMVDTIHHEEIQQHIVDVLDLADYVHVKGKSGNLTDIKVKMQKLENPDKHTNFVNCGADVNIPVGEVFTSPQLKGTNGVLHLKETFLKKLKFTDLKLT
ncbi:MAG TPA: leucyl aminopeptidase, partial [Candidatus Cloacimonetes bacterium]|nr:leucyl aminopeptidase [Candidatus Cloacimonadota bacterium]